MPRPWTDEDLIDLRRMRNDGFRLYEMAELSGRTVVEISERLSLGLPPLRGRIPRYSDVTSREGPRVPAPVIAERAARRAAAARDLTGAIFGDPPMGFSALDRQRRSA